MLLEFRSRNVGSNYVARNVVSNSVIPDIRTVSKKKIGHKTFVITTQVFGHRQVVGRGHRGNGGSGTIGTIRRTQKITKEVAEAWKEGRAVGWPKAKKDVKPGDIQEC